MRELERRVLLSVLDRKWREHLYEMDYLREGIYLRAYSQRDPLVEYQREGFEMFAAMMDGIKEESVGFLFNLEVQVEEDDEDEVDVEVEVEEPSPSSRWRAARRRSAEQPSRSGPRASSGRQPRRTCPTRRPPRTARPRSRTDGRADDDAFAKVGRNAQCPCGSGKKYKMCHGRPGGPTGLTRARSRVVDEARRLEPPTTSAVTRRSPSARASRQANSSAVQRHRWSGVRSKRAARARERSP